MAKLILSVQAVNVKGLGVMIITKDPWGGICISLLTTLDLMMMGHK